MAKLEFRVDTNSAEHIYLSAKAYLITRNWWPDGDDPGIWINEQMKLTGISFTDALAIQLTKDGVNFQN